MPYGLLLDDGTECRLRNGGGEASRDDGVGRAYGCNGDSAVLASFEARGWDPTTIIDRSHPLWTVKVGPVRAGNLPPPQTHTVTTAWFAGN
jgi:serine/threonine-protein kinase